jgi:hypothetical protein
MGWIKDHTGSYAGGLLLLTTLGIIAMGVVLMLGRDDVGRTHRASRINDSIVNLSSKRDQACCAQLRTHAIS